MTAAKASLVFVVFLDVMGQGLAFPIFATILLSDVVPFLATGTPDTTRQLVYGLVIAAFFGSWFLGAVYVSSLSDSLGRKTGMLACLAGAFAGYVLTVMAIAWASLPLLIVSRIVSGFMSGNQPIAQAAMVNMSNDEVDKARNLGLVVFGSSLGLVGGPVIGGVLSDVGVGSPQTALLLPFVASAVLVALAIIAVSIFYRETSTERSPLRIEPLAIFTLLWKVTRRPTIMRISVVYFAYMLGWMTAYVFVDTFLAGADALGSLGTSLGMVALGAGLAVSSSVLLPRLSKFAAAKGLIIGAIVLAALSSLGFASTHLVGLNYSMLLLLGVAHGIALPTFFGLYSSAAGKTEQGWVMGVSIALFALAAGIGSLIGGALGELTLVAPFMLGAAMIALALLIMAFAWRAPEMRTLTARK